MKIVILLLVFILWMPDFTLKCSWNYSGVLSGSAGLYKSCFCYCWCIGMYGLWDSLLTHQANHWDSFVATGLYLGTHLFAFLAYISVLKLAKKRLSKIRRSHMHYHMWKKEFMNVFKGRLWFPEITSSKNGLNQFKYKYLHTVILFFIL